MCRVTQINQTQLDGSPGDREKYPVQKSTWFGYTFDVVQKFGEVYGKTFPLIVVFFPTFGLLFSSTKLKNLAITSSFSFCFTVVIQRIWQRFDRTNRENIQKELTLVSEKELALVENESQLPEGIGDRQNQFDLRGSRVMAYFQKDKIQNSINITEDPLYSLNVIESIINSVDDDLKRYLEEYGGLVEETFKDVKEELELQAFLDKIGDLLCQVQGKREKQKSYSEKSSQQILEDANACSQALKGMALSAKICKELVRLQTEGLLKFKGEELLKAFHENLYKEISFSKFNIEIFCIGFEYYCVYTRGKEISALEADIRELEAQKSVLKNNPNNYKEHVEAYFRAIDLTKESISARIRQLHAKNISKQREIARDIFEAALCGMQDSFELVKDKTTLFNNFPKTLSSLMFMNGCVGGFVALVSSVFNLTKILLSKQRYENIGVEVKKCEEVLDNYVKDLLEDYRKKNVGKEPSDDDLTDNYVRFLKLKIEALKKSKTKRVRHIIEKFIKFSDDFVSLSRSVKVLVVLVGISVGSSTIGVLVTATSIVTVFSLGAGIYKFGRKLYSSRHKISYAYRMISLQFLRPGQFERLEMTLKQLQGSVHELENWKTQLRDLEQETVADDAEALSEYDTKRARIQKEISSCTENVEITYSAMEKVKNNYFNIVQQIQMAQDNLFVRELADKVNGYTDQDMASLRGFLNTELGLPDENGEIKLKESQIAHNKAIWVERLRNLGYYTFKPLTSELILQFATSTPSSVLNEDSSSENVS